MNDDERLDWLDETGTAYVWVGKAEWTVTCQNACFDPAALNLHPVFSEGNVTIYAVP
jgi:hypothetical protein